MPCDRDQGPHSDPTNCRVCHCIFEWEWNVHRHCLSRLAEKYVRWQSCHQRMYPPEKHITTCVMPVPSCRCHRYCATVPVESRLCHRELQLLLCTWLCHRACANVSVPAPSHPCHCSITSDTQAVNIASVTYPLMVQPCWCCYRLY